jgi:hypothetical protein
MVAKITQIPTTASLQDQIKALLAGASEEERLEAMKIFQPPKRDIKRLLEVRAELETIAANKLGIADGRLV